jgi:hypothetical protein
MSKARDLEFDIMLSFAGPERPYAEAIAAIAKANGIRVFIDSEHDAEMWGKNLFEYLDHAFRERGAYVLILVSAAYRDRAYTRVEQLAAFDRTLAARDCILPVRIDDTHLDGLPRATKFLDLRVKGVVGVCKDLVERLKGSNEKFVVPPELAVPRVPSGALPAKVLASYLHEHCANQTTAAFGALVYDESCADLRRLLRDKDYWEALDLVSGPHMEIFAIRDSTAPEPDEERSMEFLTATSTPGPWRQDYYFSTLMKEYFGRARRLAKYPLLLVFIVEDRRVIFSRLIDIDGAGIDEIFRSLSALLSTIAKAIVDVAESSDRAGLPGHLRTTLLEANYVMYALNGPDDSSDAVRTLMTFVE